MLRSQHSKVCPLHILFSCDIAEAFFFHFGVGGADTVGVHVHPRLARPPLTQERRRHTLPFRRS